MFVDVLGEHPYMLKFILCRIVTGSISLMKNYITIGIVVIIEMIIVENIRSASHSKNFI